MTVERPELLPIDWYEMNQFRTCLYCENAGLFLNTLDNLEAVVCLHYDNRKLFKKDCPSNREYRTFLKVMESMETCDHWLPTGEGSERARMLAWLGIYPATSGGKFPTSEGPWDVYQQDRRESDGTAGGTGGGES